MFDEENYKSLDNAKDNLKRAVKYLNTFLKNINEFDKFDNNNDVKIRVHSLITSTTFLYDDLCEMIKDGSFIVNNESKRKYRNK